MLTFMHKTQDIKNIKLVNTWFLLSVRRGLVCPYRPLRQFSRTACFWQQESRSSLLLQVLRYCLLNTFLDLWIIPMIFEVLLLSISLRCHEKKILLHILCWYVCFDVWIDLPENFSFWEMIERCSFSFTNIQR